MFFFVAARPLHREALPPGRKLDPGCIFPRTLPSASMFPSAFLAFAAVSTKSVERWFSTFCPAMSLHLMPHLENHAGRRILQCVDNQKQRRRGLTLTFFPCAPTRPPAEPVVFLATRSPPNPVEWLGNYLLRNNPQSAPPAAN